MAGARRDGTLAVMRIEEGLFDPIMGLMMRGHFRDLVGGPQT